MSGTVLPFLLAGTSPRWEPRLEHLDSRGAQLASRFWAGKGHASNAKAACLERIEAVWREPARVREALAELRPEERTVVSIVQRYGGSISGPLLRAELWARGVVRSAKADDPVVPYRRMEARSDPVLGLCDRLVLLKDPEFYDSSLFLERRYPSVSLARPLAAVVEAAAPLRWEPSAPVMRPPGSTGARAAAEVLVDLERIASALEGLGTWKVNQGGALPAGVQKRLVKLCPTAADDPLSPPDSAILLYYVLRDLGAVESDGLVARLRRERAEELLRRPFAPLASDWTRAWSRLRLWQDGIGAVPEREGGTEAVRVRPEEMKTARELLAWALTRVAHAAGDVAAAAGGWLDLETFLLDLYRQVGERGMSFYWHGFAWEPVFVSAAGREELKGSERQRAFWMSREGTWVANALLSTLAFLGLVERGRSAAAGAERWCFRLTELGRAVFGAPEVAHQPASAAGEKCLTVQPNHEILVYLDAVDGEVIATLGRVADREAAGGPVHTYRLTRESVYRALESGMSPSTAEEFLASRSRNGVPHNVSQSIADWARKREAQVVRSGVALAFVSDVAAPGGRVLGPRVSLLSRRAAAAQATALGISAEPGAPCPEWRVDEHGIVSPERPLSLVGKARLARFARRAGGTWQVTADTVKAARERGITADRILGWLAAHAARDVPPILQAAIRNWSGKGRGAFLGEATLLQLDDPDACEAVRTSERFRPLLRGTLAPGCFLVVEGGREEAARLLQELGFDAGRPCATVPLDVGAPSTATPEERLDAIARELAAMRRRARS